MSATVSQTLELGNYYAGNGLWHNAANAFRSALAQLHSRKEPGESLEPVPVLNQVLHEIRDTAVDLTSSTVLPRVRKALLRLRNAQAAAHPGLGLDQLWCVSAFRNQRVNGWTIGYHPARNDIGVPGHRIPLPSNDAVALFLELGDAQLQSAPVSAKITAQLAYALSHHAQANVAIMIELYSVGKVLLEDGSDAIEDAAHDYRRALLLRPRSSWTLAHLAEAYRNLANSWPPSMEEMTTPQRRMTHYVMALRYFEAAIAENQNDFWAHAHFGATIVNVRAFAGRSGLPGQPGNVPDLDGLLEVWFGNHTTAQQRDHQLLDKAMVALNTAQALRGDFYPWAQMYAADVLLIRSIADEEPDDQAPGAAVLAGVLTLDAIGLQPELARNLFEPGELYDNPFYQFGLLHLWCKNYLLAWKYVCIGMGRSFKFRFIPGLDVLLGYQLLANVWDWKLTRPMQRVRSTDMPLFEYLPREPPVRIPEQPSTRDELIDFLDKVFRTVCRPMVDTFITKRPSISIRVSLLQVSFTLRNLLHILKTEGKSPDAMRTAEKLRRDMKACIEEILARSKLLFESSEVDLNYDDDRVRIEMLFTHVYSDGLSYHMARGLKLKKLKGTARAGREQRSPLARPSRSSPGSVRARARRSRP